MPKPKSGNDPWKAVAVKLPPQMMAEAERYADLYHTSLSALLREGLVLRMHGQQSAEPTSGMTVIPPATIAVFTRLADTLSTAADELRKLCHLPTAEEYNGHTYTLLAPEEPAAKVRTRGHTVMPAVPGSMSDHTADDADYDPAIHSLGKLCPRRHEYRGTGQSVLRISNRHCRACDREKFHERKQAKRQMQRA
jgi:hypothetical protein